jgi:hypothetical protein
LAVIGFTLIPPELLERFIEFAPSFESRWNSEDNCHRDDDGHDSLCGVCAEFSAYFRDHCSDFSVDSLTDLFAFVESHVQPRENVDSTDLDNALCTCFLENISSEPAGEIGKPHMGPNSRGFFNLWHFPATQ